MRLRFAAHSEIGLVRKNNQDSGYASPHLLVVADGMGGAAAGDLASAVAIDTIRTVHEPVAGEQMLGVLAGAMHQANDRIAALVEQDYALEGMGTTVTGVLFDGSQLGLAHIGDSRAYLLHDSRLERLTHDHSWVQSLVDSGKISDAEAAVHPHRSLLLKVLNGQPANDPDVTLVKVEPGDRLLLCSDGLCGLVDDPVIEAALQTADLDAALRRLVKEARTEGGVDNITVILADVVEADGTDAPVVLGAAAELTLPSALLDLTPGGGVATATGPATATTAAGAGADGDGASSSPASTSSAGAPTDGSTPKDDEARYSPQPPRSRPLGRSLAALVLAVLVVGAALGSAYAWTRTQFFVGARGDQVAIFQGLNQSLPGLSLSRLYEVQPLAVSALPPYYQERVRASIDVPDLSGARLTVTELTDAVRRCAPRAPSASTSPGAGPSATGSLSARPSAITTPSSSSSRSAAVTSMPAASPSVRAAPPRSPAATPRKPSAPATRATPAPSSPSRSSLPAAVDC